jgi:hypothetical protein
MSKELVPTEQKQVLFYDDEVTAVRMTDGSVYVPVRPICDRLGIAWPAQRLRILRDAVLAEELTPVIVTITGTGQQVETLCLPLDYISGFLFGITASRVKEEVRDRLIQYQRECHKVLAEAFQDGRLTADPVFDDLLQQDTPEVQAYKLIQGMLHLARNQILIKARLDEHEERLERIESHLGDPGHHVAPDQASQVSQAVKAVAIVLGKKTGKNEFGGVYGELYRREGITSYKQLPVNRFEAVMHWLADWYRELTDGADVPF